MNKSLKGERGREILSISKKKFKMDLIHCNYISVLIMLISLRLINLSLSTKAHLTFKYYYANNKLLRIAYDDRYAARINVYCFKQLKKKRERERKIVA